MPNLITEDWIEQALLGRLTAAPGWATLNCHTADLANPADASGRADKREVILRGLLREAVLRLTKDETQKVKLAARHLLHRLLEESPRVLAQDWFKDRQTQEAVRSAVVTVLDADLPSSYDRALFKQKCDKVFDVIVDYASRGRKWAA